MAWLASLAAGGGQEVAGMAAGLELRALDTPGAAELPGITYERWDGVEGSRVTPSARSSAARRGATVAGLAATLEFPATGEQSFLERVRGYFVAPHSGEIRLVVSSDDNSELWLSPGEDPFARRRVAWIAGEGALGWTNPMETGRVPSQWTGPIQVKQGKRYYFEAYHKQGGSKAHFSIRMQSKGEKEISPIPASALRPWVGIATDANDDGLPDDWQGKYHLLDGGKGSSYEDADGDGVSNFEEFQASTDPSDASPVKGALLWEVWYGLPGSQVADLVHAPRFSGPADHSAFVFAGSTPVISAGYSGSRLSGFLIPSESGEYELAVAGDDSTELWLSGTESVHGKNRMAFGTSWRPKGDWFVPPSQQTKPVRLEAGRSYYFEVIQKDGGPPGWAGIGWKKTGEKTFVEIASRFLASPGIPADDQDRDFLPDPWVAEAKRLLPEESRDKVVFTEQGDPDGDGLPNWMEARLGTSPLEKSQVAGALVREWWLNVSGRSLANARNRGVFLEPPSMLELSLGAASEAYTADWYASRLRGYVVAPVTGKYRFWVSGDDQAEFWISSDSTKFRKHLAAEVMPGPWEVSTAQVHTKRQEWDARPAQRSAEIELKKGESYFIEMLLKDSGGDDHVALAWQYRVEDGKEWSQRGLVDSQALVSFEGDEDDLDDDYLPDSWEKKYGLDPGDNGRQDRTKQGEAGDHDGDGLTNREEFLLGTNPCLADTDGDGATDHDEVRLYLTDPLRKDVVPPVEFVNFPLDGFNAVPGKWFLSAGGTLFSMAQNGAVDFTFEADEPGIHVVELTARVRSTDGYYPVIRAEVGVDDTMIGAPDVVREASTGRWHSQWLAQGTHTVRVHNRNVRLGAGLEILSLKVLRYEKQELDDHAVPVWMGNLLRARNQVTIIPSESKVSPVCIEGTTRLEGGVSIRSPGGVTVSRGLEGSWFANVDLASSSATGMRFAFENGAVESEKTVEWVETNLFSPRQEATRLRVGDALKFSARNEETDGTGFADGVLTVDAKAVEGDPARQPIVVRFDDPGMHRVEVVVRVGSATRRALMEVEVVEADFGKVLELVNATPRDWSLPGIPAGVALEADHGLALVEQESKNSRKFKVSYQGYLEQPAVLARLSEGGPVMAVTCFNAVSFSSSTETNDAHIVEVLPDGTRVVEVGYAIRGPVPAGLSIWIDMFVPDAVFENGGTRYHLTAADFDENGLAKIRIYAIAGSDDEVKVCHWINPDYQDEEVAP